MHVCARSSASRFPDILLGPCDSAIDSPPGLMLQYNGSAGVAQLVEQLFCKQQVVSSSLSTGSRNQRAVNPLSFLCPKYLV